MSLKPYPEYKDSGVEWIGALPESWVATPLKHVARFVAGGTPDSANSNYWLESDGLDWVAIGDMKVVDAGGRTTRRISADGLAAARLTASSTTAVLFAMYASVGAVALLRRPAVWNQAILGLVPTDSLGTGYLYYAMKSLRAALPYFYRSNTQDNLNAEQVGNLVIALPPIAQQNSIAEFLDRETAEIDAFIADQEELIALLAERRAATISHTVTKGLDPSAALVKTSSPWFPELPAGWDILACRLGTALIQTGPFGSQLHSHEYVQGGVPLVNPMHMVDGEIQPSVSMTVTHEKAKDLERHLLRLGDLVVARRGELGRSAVVTTEAIGYLCGTGSAIVRVKPQRFDADYFQAVFSSKQVRDALLQFSVGSTMDNLNTDMIGALRLPAPPISEQRAIMAHILRETAEIDAAVVNAREATALSKERRAALISAAVNGKIDVRNQ